LNEAERQKIISELKIFYKELRRYKDRQLKRQETEFSEPQKRALEALRLKLQRQYGRLSEVISEYGGAAYLPILNRNYEVFSYSLGSLDMDYRGLEGLNVAVNVVTRAIGRLEAITIAESESEDVGWVKAEPLPKAFLSHGKESKALVTVAEFLRSLGVEPVLVEDQPSLDKTVDDKVKYYLGQADFVVILATGDDEIGGKLHPRQNIIHEIGLAQNTHAGRILYLLEEGAEFPSNIRPKVWQAFKQENMENVLLYIVRELRAFGILGPVKLVTIPDS